MKHIAFAALALFASPVAAQTLCEPYPMMAERLTGLGEIPTSRGLEHRGVVAEHWAHPETGDWSLVMVRADGTACLVFYGIDFHRVAAPPNI